MSKMVAGLVLCCHDLDVICQSRDGLTENECAENDVAQP